MLAGKTLTRDETKRSVLDHSAVAPAQDEGLPWKAGKGPLQADEIIVDNQSQDALMQNHSTRFFNR